MAHQLADEVLKEILELVLDVPDAKFSNVDTVSPFSKVSWSSSAVLLVCKRWMRVATPMLLECVILRSAGQAGAFASMLVRNSRFGRFVRRLRVEGSWPKYITSGLVISKLHAVRELSISIGVQASDNPKDIVTLLEHLHDVEHLAITDFIDHNVYNNAQRRIAAALGSSIPFWMKLVRSLSQRGHVS